MSESSDKKDTQFSAKSTAEEVTAGLDLHGATWLVTGCNSGLGRETTRVLGMRGAHVIGTARTDAKAQETFRTLGIEGTPIACELADFASVQSAVQAIHATGRPLDGIIANAGIMAVATLEQAYGYELQFFVNHVGHFALVTGLLERLSEAARVVVLSSGAYRMAGEQGLDLENLSGAKDYDPWRMYGRSKLANILFTRELSRRFSLENGRKTANCLHPGVIETKLARHVPDREAMFDKMRAQVKTVAQGAATQCFVATRPELATTSGCYFSDCQRKSLAADAKDDRLAEALWKRSEAIVAELS